LHHLEESNGMLTADGEGELRAKETKTFLGIAEGKPKRIYIGKLAEKQCRE
jgi:hypothetical protein